MFVVGLYLILISLVHSQDICTTVNCGSGVCLLTQNPALPYFCRCPNGANSILPCPSQNPCSGNPCGQGICEIVPSLIHGYLCRCPGDQISLTSCNITRSSCYSNPCVNGLCIEGISTYFCNCLPTWTGRLCDVKISSPCSRNPCNSGKCFELNDPNIPFVCLCPNGQFGISCYSSLPSRVFTTKRPPPLTTTTTTTSVTPRVLYECNPFEKQSCKNGGSCLQTTYKYRCLCAAGFTGTFCEMNINECASNPCQHGGICYDLQASYMCYCPDGRFHQHCLPRSIQTSTARTLLCPCQNGGVCSISGSPICSCRNGFTGRFCEKFLATNGCNGIQCSNGGTCVESISSSSITTYCTCKHGYSGKHCEIEYFQCRSNGRFVDSYNCAQGKYFECIYYHQDIGTNSNNGLLLSRTCPSSLRFNSDQDRCDYPHNVKCPYV